MFINLLVLSSLLSVRSQSTAVGSAILMSTSSLQPSGNYSIGYVTTADSFVCRRIQMFKFPAGLSGSATSITLNALPLAQPTLCVISLSLYSFTDGSQIGSSFRGSFTIGGGLIGNGVREVSNTMNVTGYGWQLVSGSLYYLTIEAISFNSTGVPCRFMVPYGVSKVVPQTYSIVLQQGLVGFPCGSTPWATMATVDGGYIRMSIGGVLSITKTSTDYPRISASPTPGVIMTSASMTSTLIPIDESSSDTPSASFTSSETPSVSPTNSVSCSPTAAPLPSVSQSLNTSVPIDTAVAVAASISSVSTINTGSIVGWVIGAIALTSLAISVAAFNASRSMRASINKLSGLKEMRSPGYKGSVVTLNPAVQYGI